MADSAKSEVARDAHKDLASRYEAMIDGAGRRGSGDRNRSLFPREGSETGREDASSVNAPLAVALTAREVQGD